MYSNVEVNNLNTLTQYSMPNQGIDLDTSEEGEGENDMELFIRNRQFRPPAFFDVQSTLGTCAYILENTSRCEQNVTFSLLFNLESLGIRDANIIFDTIQQLNARLDEESIYELIDYWNENHSELLPYFLSSRFRGGRPRRRVATRGDTPLEIYEEDNRNE